MAATSHHHHARPALRYLLILDFEATCASPTPANFKQEIIEFPCLVYSLEIESLTAMFHEYVRPVYNPRLTPFCTQLTGISQWTVDSGEPFPNVWRRFLEFLADLCLADPPSSFIFLTCGDWDLGRMLPRQLELSGIEPPDTYGSSSVDFGSWINVKKAFAEFYGKPRVGGMLEMLHELDMQVEGRHHSGIDDCRNISRIVSRMREDGWRPELSGEEE